MNSQQTIYIIAGPTASGKSARALELAADRDGVIINADSMQIYDALPTLTAQPSNQDKENVPHVLYGALAPHESCSAGRWREMARAAIEETLKSGKTPIVTGGSGLYIKALVEGLSPIPETPPEIRTAMTGLHDQVGTEKFFSLLRERDPLTASRIDGTNKARLIRAMEVLEATGKPLATWQDQDKLGPPADWNFKIEVIIPEREDLYERCNRRFDLMLDSGALDEVEDLDRKITAGDVAEDALITKALGFRPLRSYIKGALSKETAIEQSRGETRQYAKRQITWFKHQL